MKTILLFCSLMMFGTLAKAQQSKQNIDYQYFRDTKSYYAYELFKDLRNGDKNELRLNFSANESFSKIDKIYLKDEGNEIKLSFKPRQDIIKTDNPDQKHYPIVFDSKILESKKLSCEAEIVFVLDNGSNYSLPFSLCVIRTALATH